MMWNFCINSIVGLILLMSRCVDGDLNDCWNVVQNALRTISGIHNRFGFLT